MRKETLILIAQLLEAGEEVRAEVADAFVRMGPRAEIELLAIAEEIASPWERVREAAAISLGALGPHAAPVARALLHATQDIDELVRAAAVEALGCLGLRDAEIVSTVLWYLGDRSDCVRVASARALPRLCADADGTVVQRLLYRLDDLDQEALAVVKKELQSLAREAHARVGFLFRGLLLDPRSGVRAAALYGLIHSLTRAERGMESLVSALTSGQRFVRLFALTSLAWMGPAAAEALPTLRQLLADPDPRVRQYTREAIARINSSK